MESSIEASDEYLDGYLSPVVRFGMVVAAHKADGVRVCLTYDDADAVIKYIIENGDALSERLADRFLARLDPELAGHVLKVNQRMIDTLRLETSAEITGPGSVTGANLPEFLLSIFGKLVLVRSSFTICVDDDQFNLRSSEPLRMHSKLWLRIILVSDSDLTVLRKEWSHDECASFYRSALSLREDFESEMLDTYRHFIGECTQSNLTIKNLHRISLATFGVSRAAFNDVLLDVPKNELLYFRSAPHWPRHGDLVPGATLKALLAFAGQFLAAPTPVQGRSLTAAVDLFRAQAPGELPAYKIVSVDDSSGTRGLLLAEISETYSNFVGVAADEDLEFSTGHLSALVSGYDGADLLERVRVGRVPSNQVASILSVDIATGL